MSRPLRIEVEGGFYHVMNRGLARMPIVRDDRDRKSFLGVLGEAADHFAVRAHAYSLLDNHYHLLLETPLGNLARFMRHLNGIYTQRFNRRHRRDGPLFRGRYKAILLDRDSYLLELVRYIHLNPVRAGIVFRPEDHRWTSHAAYLGKGGGKPPRWLETRLVLEMFARSPAKLASFVAEGVPEGLMQRFAGSNWPGLLGPERFVDRNRERIQKMRGKPIPEARRYAKRAAWKTIREEVCRRYGIGEDELMRPRRKERARPREAAVYLARRCGQMSHREIGEALGMSPPAAATAFRRAGWKAQKDGAFGKDLQRLLNIINET